MWSSHCSESWRQSKCQEFKASLPSKFEATLVISWAPVSKQINKQSKMWICWLCKFLWRQRLLAQARGLNHHARAGTSPQVAWEHAIDNLSTCFHSVKWVDRNWRKSLGSFGRGDEPGPFIMGTDSLFISHPCDLSLFLIGCHWECHGRKEAWEAG